MSTILNDDDDFIVTADGKKVIKDGRSLKVRLTLMDAAHPGDDYRLQRPGPRYNTDAAAADRREVSFGGYLKDLGDAWRNPDPAPIVAADKKPVADARESAHATMVGDLANAWRGATQ
jgi:hypothetical protein